MRRLFLVLPVVCLVVFTVIGWGYCQFGKSREGLGGTMELRVVERKESIGSNPDEMLREFSVRVTNKGSSSVTFSNNMFVLEADGQRIPVNRLRYPERFTLKPGESMQVSRIFFSLPKKAEMKTLYLMIRGQVAGKVNL